MNILVAGGAGYIGSHCVYKLIQLGHNVVVVDNLCMGHKESLPKDVIFYKKNIGDHHSIKSILIDHSIECVMHFAAFAYVGESVTSPLKYYKNNVVETLNLLETMLQVGIKKFIFSSTCATYGNPEQLPITEETPQNPINPYGQTKLDVENALKALANAADFRFVSLRYFNASGASSDGSIGEDHTPETHLIPLVFQTILGQRKNITIFGTDYNTPDGTCQRDYIHVDDLAQAHILAIDKLNNPNTQLFLNLGIGKPYSVRQVIQTVEEVTGKSVPIIEGERRPGDPATLYTDSSRAQKELKWTIQYKDLQSIIQSAWNWHKNHPNGYRSTTNSLA